MEEERRKEIVSGVLEQEMGAHIRLSEYMDIWALDARLLMLKSSLGLSP